MRQPKLVSLLDQPPQPGILTYINRYSLHEFTCRIIDITTLKRPHNIQDRNIDTIKSSWIHLYSTEHDREDPNTQRSTKWCTTSSVCDVFFYSGAPIIIKNVTLTETDASVGVYLVLNKNGDNWWDDMNVIPRIQIDTTSYSLYIPVILSSLFVKFTAQLFGRLDITSAWAVYKNADVTTSMIIKIFSLIGNHWRRGSGITLWPPFLIGIFGHFSIGISIMLFNSLLSVGSSTRALAAHDPVIGLHWNKRALLSKATYIHNRTCFLSNWRFRVLLKGPTVMGSSGAATGNHLITNPMSEPALGWPPDKICVFSRALNHHLFLRLVTSSLRIKCSLFA